MMMKTQKIVDILLFYCFVMYAHVALGFAVLPAPGDDCSTPQVLELDMGFINLGRGCTPPECLSNETACRTLTIQLVDSLRFKYECFAVILEGQNPYTEDFDIFYPSSCREIPSFSDDLPTRYLLDVGFMPPGSALDLVICANQDTADMVVELMSTPSGLCAPVHCDITIDCPTDKFLAPAHGTCDYPLPDYSAEVKINYDCDLVYEQLYVDQVPPPGTLLDRDTIISFYLKTKKGDAVSVIDRCDINVDLLPDTLGPPFSVSGDSLMMLDCGDVPPEFESFSVMGDVASLTTKVEPYTVDMCNGFEMVYKWTATDVCANSTTVERRVRFSPDLTPPKLTGLPDEMELAKGDDCMYTGKLPLADIVDDCSGQGVLVTRLYNEEGEFVAFVDKEIETDISGGYLVYEVDDHCGNLTSDTVRIKKDEIQTNELVCLDDLQYVLSPLGSCKIIADWAAPSINNSCGSSTLEQIQGPSAGDVLEPGDYEVVYELRNSNGTVSHCSFSVKVKLAEIEELQCVDINYSVDPKCRHDLLYEAIYEYNKISCLDDFSVRLYSKGGIDIDSSTFKDYIGERIEYELCYLPSMYCCRAEVLLEDKLKPVLECEDYRVRCTEDIDYHQPHAYNECREVTYRVIHQLYEETCDDPDTRGVVSRTYIATDIYGNQSDPCTQRFEIIREDIDDLIRDGRLVDPADTILRCEDRAAFEAGELTITMPTLDGLPIHADSLPHCGLSMVYDDTPLLDVDCHYKVMRIYRIDDGSCALGKNEVTFTQFITFQDTTPPTMSIDQRYLKLSTGDVSCEIYTTLPKATLYDNCQDAEDLALSYFIKDIEVSEDGGAHLDVGRHIVHYIAEDNCHNATRDSIIIDVVDHTPPVAVCLEYTVVSLSHGSAWLDAKDVDAGSTDECGDIYRYEIRRMDNTCEASDTLFAESVGFCCEDAGQSIPVVLRVTDFSGNTNECMVIVDVQQKIPPRFVCLPDLELSCYAHDVLLDSLERAKYLGTFVSDSTHRHKVDLPVEWSMGEGINDFYDGLYLSTCAGITWAERVEEDINTCGVGTARRIFTFYDGSGAPVDSCIQTIDFYYQDEHIDIKLVDWPESTVEVYGCNPYEGMTNVTFGKPHYSGGRTCAQIGFGYKDTKVTVDSTHEDICYKILRKWQLIDWCDPDNDISDHYSYSQWIVVHPDTAVHVMISGAVQDYYGKPLADVSLTLTNELSSNKTTTDANGIYEYDLMAQPDATITLHADYESDIYEGISAADVYLLQAHILGMSGFKHAYQYVAADVYHDGKIDSRDLIGVGKLAMGAAYGGDPTSWRFCEKDKVINHGNYSIDTDIDDGLHLVSAEYADIGLTAVKMADLDNSYMNSMADVRSSKAISMTDISMSAGELYTIDIPLIDLAADLAQAKLYINPELVPEVLVAADDGVDYLYGEGVLSLMYSHLTTLSPSIQLTVVPSVDTRLSDVLSLHSGRMWDRQLREGAWTIAYETETIAESTVSPNPFSTQTVITYSLSAASDVEIEVITAHGQQVILEKISQSRGAHQYVISASDLPSTGWYICSIRTISGVSTHRILRVE